ncbi:MAG: glycosyltransferase family 2 protein [Candidatus Omnitrophota bacterium]
MRVCVIIPAYNEARAIGGIVDKIKKAGLEVLIVDDGSRDNTAQVAKAAGGKVISNDVNKGKGVSLAKGFNYALSHNFNAVITMDGDGQHLPSDIPKFINRAAASDNSFFIGNRMIKVRNMPWLRLVTNKVMSWLISVVARQEIPDTQCGFRLIKKDALEKIRLKTSKFEAESEMLLQVSRAGFNIESVTISTVYRGEKSKINPVTDTVRFIRFIMRELTK